MWMPKPRLPDRPSEPAALILALVVLVLGLVAVPAAAQDGAATGTADGAVAEGAAPDEALTGEAGDDAAEDPETGADDVPDIDAILEGGEEVLGGGGFTYDPGDRRDPFKSLLRAREESGPRGPRPDGIPGLLIDELIISGIFRTSEGWVAQVQSAEKDKSYLIRIGDQLYDGDVISMSRNEVVFKQIVEDQAALKPFREVVKKLNP